VLEGRARGDGGGCRAERVDDVVASGEPHLDLGRPDRAHELEPGGEALRTDVAADLARAEIRGTGGAERDHPRFREPAPEIGELIVRVHDRRALRRQTFDGLAFRTRHPFDAAEAFEVLGAGVGDDSDRRPCDAHELGDLACMVRAHLDDREAVLRVEPQQSHWNADVIVEIAARRKGRPGAREDGGDHLLDGGLAVAARDADERAGVVRAPAHGRARQGRLRVVHDDLRELRLHLLAHDGGGRAGSLRRGDELRAVEPRPAQGDEELIGRKRARIGRDAGERAVHAREPAAADSRECGERALHADPPSAARTTA
jgi:hypothetical protein